LKEVIGSIQILIDPDMEVPR